MLQHPTSLGDAIVCAEKADQALYVLGGNRGGSFKGNLGDSGASGSGGNFGGFQRSSGFQYHENSGFQHGNYCGQRVSQRVGLSGSRGGQFGNWQPKPFRPFSSSNGGHPYKGPAPMDLGMA